MSDEINTESCASQAAPDAVAAERGDITEAVALLREIRQAGTNVDIEDLHWIESMLPLSRPVRRRLIAALMRAGHDDEAEHLLTQCLLTWPDDQCFMRLLVQCRMRQNRLDAAERGMARLLVSSPIDRRNLMLAADLSMARGRATDAISTLLALNLRFPGEPEIEQRLIDAELAAGRTTSASRLLDHCRSVPPETRARVLAAHHQQRDALDVLDAEVCRTSVACRRLRLTLLSQCAASDELRAAIDDAASDEDASVAIEAAAIALEIGDFEQAATIARSRCDEPMVRRDAIAVLAIAETFAQRFAPAFTNPCAAGASSTTLTHAAEILEARPKSNPLQMRVRMASLWLRAERGDVLRRQLDPRRAAADPDASILKPLLIDAVSRLNRAIQSPEDAPTWLNEAERQRLSESRDIGCVLLGQSVVAA